ncbi:hypothetical protein GBAR_LOCUS12871 [Geodia barretti]|uniref:Death domain-containing protein n=1 Tax=Geodia barretti TaxID=519541 RepID=A0AA35S218_GEOBA|nr:hypothetical protein GBAR_LOCUS12871 [Geodia barretti]
MDTYGEDMKKFREETSMEQMLLEKELLAIEAVPPDAVEVFIEKDSVKTKTLEDLQEFRKAFSGFYMVNECAVLLKEIGDEVIVAWYIIPTDQQEDFLFEYVGDSERNIPKEVLLFCASEILEFVDFKVLQQELEKHGVPKSVYQMPAEEGSRPSFETTYEMLQRIGGVEGGTGAFYRSLRDTQDSVHDHKFVADKLENRAQGMLHQVITLPEGCGPLNIFHLRLGDISEQRSGPADSGGQGSGSSEANVPSYILPPSTFVAMGEEMLAKIPVSKPQIPEPITREKIYVLSSLARRPSSSEPGVKFVQCSLHSELSHVYTGIETEICWKDAGIGLFLPKVELEKEINFTVKVVNDDYELPLEYRNMPLVSAMCQITASDKLPQPVRVRMQHCTAVENENVMGFMVAHGEPPYRFSPLPGGVFPQGECYGEIELGKFSILSIIRRIFGPIECAVHVCYCADSSADFVVTKNLPLHVAAVKKEYEDAKLDQYIATCSSSSTGIAFEAPKMSTNGWSVEPQSKPFKISRRVIVNYEPGQVIPHIKLDIIWTGQGPQRKEKINISVDGAEGLESFKLTCEPLFPCSPQQLGSFTAQQQDRTSETQLADRPFPSKIEPRPSALDTPTLPLLQRFPTRSGHFINVIERISVKGHCLCIHLLNDKWGMVANNLELKHRCDPNRVTEAVLVRWLEKEPHTWVDLVTALREIELGALATEIEDNLCRSQQDRPTLPLLKRFPTQSGHTTNIVEGIRAKCRDLCTRLLRDDWGAVIKSMELEHRNNPCQIAETVFQRWLAEEPNASWAELVSALRSIGLGKLPRKIEKNLLPPSVEH